VEESCLACVIQDTIFRTGRRDQRRLTKNARISYITAEIRTGPLRNTGQKSYRYKRVAIGTKRKTKIKEGIFMEQSPY
jgi:hypothetical protein